MTNAIETLERPTPEYVRERLDAFDKNSVYYGVERAVDLVFRQWPANTERDQVLVKVVVLNRLYSTSIYDVHSVARHIVKSGIDARLRAGDQSIVDVVANVELSSGTRCFLSFAAKYCAWHEPAQFQIYDSLVCAMLWEYRKGSGFAEFRRYELTSSYLRFVELVDAFRSHFGLSGFSRKEIDKFLWIEGRRRFPISDSESDGDVQ